MAALLTDVAKRAGVSLATASRAFGDPHRLAAATRQRVLSAASEIGYEASAGVSVRTFGVIVPDSANPIFAALLKAMQNQAWPGRHRMMLSDTNEEPEREREILGEATTLDGVILCSPRLPAEEISVITRGTPLVTINREVEHTTSILIEATIGIRQAVEHLSALGHRKLVYVPGPAASWANARRLETASESCRAWNIELVVVGNQAATIQGGLAAAASVTAAGPTAVIAYNDLVALGVKSGVRSLGRRCPEDISIIGIDDLDIAAISGPGLTSVRVAIERGGSLAVELLLERIAGKPPKPALHLDSQLIVRGSTTTAPKSLARRAPRSR